MDGTQLLTVAYYSSRPNRGAPFQTLISLSPGWTRERIGADESGMSPQKRDPSVLVDDSHSHLYANAAHGHSYLYANGKALKSHANMTNQPEAHDEEKRYGLVVQKRNINIEQLEDHKNHTQTTKVGPYEDSN